MQAEQSITLRPAVSDDVDGLIRLLRRSWLTSWAPELPFTAVQVFATTDPVTDFVRKCWPGFRVASAADEVVAMAHVEGDLLAAIHVDPAAKGRGHGSRLMDWAETTIAKTHHVARLEVRAFNRPAQRFYHGRGWTEARRYPGTECGAPVETIELRKSVSAS